MTRQPNGLLRRPDPAAVQADVDLDDRPQLRAAERATSASAVALSASSTATVIRASWASSPSTDSFAGPTTSLAIRISSRPAFTSARASHTVAQVMPIAPALICSRAISMHLCVLKCGRTAT